MSSSTDSNSNSENPNNTMDPMGENRGHKAETSLSAYQKFNRFLESIQNWIKEHLLITILLALISGTIPNLFFYTNEFIPYMRDRFLPPPPMQGEFNIAVSEITVYDQNGRKINSKDGSNASDFIYDRLASYFSQENITNINYELRSPEVTGRISGRTAADRKDAAKRLAKDIHADIVIYGVILSGDHSEFYPEFYINYIGFSQAEEIIGQHQLGSPLRIRASF